jgi:branched-chain amino acid transport system permease protein
MISAVGAALVLRQTAQIIWGPYPKAFPQFLPAKDFTLWGIHLNTTQPTIFFLGLALMLGFTFVIQRTKVGLAIRCVAQDIPTARLMGIPVDRIIQLVYFLGGFLGAAGGIFFSLYYNALWIGMGFLGTIKAWTATIFGGIGNLYGAFVGGILLGVAEALIAGYISSNYRDAIVFGILLALLAFRPSGVLGRQVAQKV